MAFGATFIATNSSSEFRMRKVYLTHHPEFDYRITIAPIEPKKKEDAGAAVADESAETEALKKDAEVTKETEAENTTEEKNESKKEDAGAAAEENKEKEVAPIKYEKTVKLYNHKKDYLG